MEPTWCGGCGSTVCGNCIGSLGRAGVLKVHWECWAKCNLGCSFCFRTLGRPLTTADASLLVKAVSTGGARTVVFAGGDPSLRADIPDLVHLARELGLLVEVHTNAHHIGSEFFEALLLCDRIGLSLDAPDAETHDRIRGNPGNHERVLRLLRRLTEAGASVSVRTMVGASNCDRVPELGGVLEKFPALSKWKLLEFTPVEQGWVNRRIHSMPTGQFDEIYKQARDSYHGTALVDALRNTDKIDTYMMISPDGYVYGTTEKAFTETGRHNYISSIVTDHLAQISDLLPLESTKHAARYLGSTEAR